MSPTNDDDTDPNIQATGAARVVMIAQEAVEDVGRALGGELPVKASGAIAHHLGQAFDLGRTYEREATIEERRAKERIEREMDRLRMDSALLLKERDRKIESLQRQLAKARQRATKR